MKKLTMQSEIRLTDVSDKETWESLLCDCRDADLRQSWEYGEAMRKCSHWDPLRHVILFHDQPVGGVQTLVKTFSIPGGVARIDHGPLLVRHTSPDLTLRIIRFLCQYWSRDQQMILYISPCLISENTDWGRFAEMGLRLLSNRPWSSGKLDLSLDEAALRRNMQKNWRRRMKKIESSGLTAEVDHSDEGFSFLMSQYEPFAEERGIAWPTVDQAREMRTTLGRGQKLQLIFARKDEQRVGGILNIGCGDTCHALITWNSPAGKRLSSPSFLIWMSIMRSRQMGYHWYDLGGMDETTCSGATNYKRGMGGIEFTLIGSFEAIPKGLYFRFLRTLINIPRAVKEKRCWGLASIFHKKIPQPRKKNIRFSVINASDLNDDFMSEWKNLSQSCRDPFLTPEWLCPCMRHHPDRLRLLAGWQRNQMVALIPMKVSKFGRLIRMGGYVSSEQQCLGLVRSEEYAEDMACELAAEVVKRYHKSVITLASLPEDRLAAALVRQFRFGGWKTVRHPGKESPYIVVKSDFQGYLKGIGRRVRREYLRRTRKMARDFSVDRKVISSPEEISHWLIQMIRLEQSSWKKDVGLFCLERREMTEHQLFAMAAAGRIRLFLLLLNNQLAAYDIEFSYKNRLWSFNTAFHPDYQEYGPGLDLQAEAIKYGFEQRLKSVELLGDKAPYKMAWSHGVRKKRLDYLFPPGIKGVLGPLGIYAVKKIRY